MEPHVSEKDLLPLPWPHPGEEILTRGLGYWIFYKEGKQGSERFSNLTEATQPVSPSKFLEKEGEEGQTGRESGGPLGQLWSSRESWSGRSDTWILGPVFPTLCGLGQVASPLWASVFPVAEMKILLHACLPPWAALRTK